MRLLTPPGLSGVAVVAFDRDRQADVASCLQTPAGQQFSFEGRTAPRLATLRLDGHACDEVLVVERGAGGVELHLHGSPALLAALRERFGRGWSGGDDGGDGADDGVLAPAERLLRHALAPEQLDLALEQRALSFAAFLAELRALPLAARRRLAGAAVERSRPALAHVEPHRLVLVGAQNAGKSTLLNKLLFRERALTGPQPGLTRDPVREVTTLLGYPFELADTAGEGAAPGAIDRRAIAAGQKLRRGATLMVVVDAGRGPTAADRELVAAAADVVVVGNKRDLPAAPWPSELTPDLLLSARDDPAAEVRRRCGELLRRHRALPPAGLVGGPAALDCDQLRALETFAQ